MLTEPGGWLARMQDFLNGIPILGAAANDLSRRFGDTFMGKVAAGMLATVLGASLLSVPWAAYKLYWLTSEINSLSTRVESLATDVRGMAQRAEDRSRRNRDLIRKNRNGLLEIRKDLLSTHRDNGGGRE